jgi:hypothetical protein
MSSVVWVVPRDVRRLEDCYFYHTMDIPNYGTVRGDWDLRGREKTYLGNVDVRGKRVLEIGPASGHLCFSMERMGAEVAAYDLSDEEEWDLVPYAGQVEDERAKRKDQIRRLNNGYWFAHRAFASRARVAYGAVYGIPHDIGQFDICTLGSILLHLRDPFLALERVTAHVRETAIVTDVAPAGLDLVGRVAVFRPDAVTRLPNDTWWDLSPALVSQFLRILGFPDTEIHFHKGLYTGGQAPGGVEIQLYTVVGRRTPRERNGGAGLVVPGGNPHEMLLTTIPFWQLARHLARRGIRAIPRRLLRTS